MSAQNLPRVKLTLARDRRVSWPRVNRTNRRASGAGEFNVARLNVDQSNAEKV